jgi:hypothetical protein
VLDPQYRYASLSTTSLVLARRRYLIIAGIATAARMPRIATTIMSSISVNPLLPRWDRDLIAETSVD